MMLSRITKLILCATSVLIAGCSDENTVFNEPTSIRAYETDAEVLSQFVEVDSRTGLFSINPDKKITAADYVVNRSREQLMMVSPINRTRFEREMNEANNLMASYKDATNVSVIYTTATSGIARNNGEGSIRLTKLSSENVTERSIARLSVAGEDNCRTELYSHGTMRISVSSGNTSTFYVAQISFIAPDRSDKGTILMAGVGKNASPYSYALTLPESMGEYLTIQGKSFIGNGSVTADFSE